LSLRWPPSFEPVDVALVARETMHLPRARTDTLAVNRRVASVRASVFVCRDCRWHTTTSKGEAWPDRCNMCLAI
jgi:hypothetical protein